jgi:D-amino-acid dehydrogenase
VGYYPTLLEDLQKEQQEDAGYTVCGALLVATDNGEMAAFEKIKQAIFERQKRRGNPSAEDLYEVSAHDACALFPPLSPPQGAVYFRRAARVDGRRLSTALRFAAESCGCSVIEGDVTELVIENQAVTGVTLPKETYQTGKVILAGGAWSRRFGEQLEVQIPVEPQRGQIIHLELPGVDTGNWPIISAPNGHYIVCWPDSRVVVGATREACSGFNPYTTASGIHEVLAEALHMAPGLRDARIQETRAGLRPMTPDGLPVMGTIPNVTGVYLATGHGSTGQQLGPYSGKLAADWALGNSSETDISAFAVNRFAD